MTECNFNHPVENEVWLVVKIKVTNLSFSVLVSCSSGVSNSDSSLLTLPCLFIQLFVKPEL